MPNKTWSSLHNHSHYSFKDGLSHPEEIVIKAKELGLTSIALTDHGCMHGTADLYLAGKKHDFKTIYGVEAYAIDDLAQWQKDRDEYKDDKKRVKAEEAEDEDATNLTSRKKSLYRKGHIVLLAQNQLGLENLYDLTHKSFRDGFYMKPRVDKRMMSQYSEGIIASSACMGGIIANKCWQMKDGDAEWKDVVREAEEYREIFKDRWFLELQFNEHEAQTFINECIVRLHHETGIPLVATNDAHYVNPEDWEAQEIFYLLRANKTFSTRGDDWEFKIKQLYIKSAQDMHDTHAEYGGNVERRLFEQAMENTLLIDGMVEDFEPDSHVRLPTLPYDNPFKKLGEDSIAKLRSMGFADDKRYVNRFMYEMKMIKDKDFANYFLIMREIIEKAKRQMLVGPGRGSSAGSLICYLNGITELDPIKHNLLFERFINIDRVELPDIDTDFQSVDDAKQMLREMFGDDNVACISTFSTFQIKGLLKDVGRVYDIDHREINITNKNIDAELKVLKGKGQDKSTLSYTLEDIERVSRSYRDFVEKYPEVGRNIGKMYDKVRHVGRHASGVIVGDDLPRETPVFMNKGVLQASFTDGIVGKNLSTMGLVKLDILSIATLNVIDHALKLISQRHDMTYDEAKALIDPKSMDINDLNIMKTVFWDGNMTGVFQITSKGMEKLFQMLKPDCFEDVAACCAIYRPGPLGSGMDKLYIHNKHHPEDVSYDHPIMEDILKETYGCLIYQEQLLNAGHLLGKLDMVDTNRLRKLFLKKTKSKEGEKDAVRDELFNKFVVGCVENGLEKVKAIKLFNDFDEWGSYGFNISHAKCYGMVSMQTAFLRTYYPLEFFAALLTHGRAQDLQSYVDDIKQQGFRILPVDINKSEHEHVIEGNAIRLAFSSVLGVGPAATNKIVLNQPYENFRDYLYRTGGGKTATLPLIRVGAFHEMEENNALLERRYELWMDYPKLRTKKNREEFERQYFETEGIPNHSAAKQVELEDELLGFNLRGTPFKLFDREKKIAAMREGGMLMSYNDFIESDINMMMMPVVVKDIKERAQRSGGMFAFLKFGDVDGVEFEAPCFATVWAHVKKRIAKSGVYLIMFNRKDESPRDLIVGKPGWVHSQYACAEYVINLDEVIL